MEAWEEEVGGRDAHSNFKKRGQGWPHGEADVSEDPGSLSGENVLLSCRFKCSTLVPSQYLKIQKSFKNYLKPTLTAG